MNTMTPDTPKVTRMVETYRHPLTLAETTIRYTFHPDRPDAPHLIRWFTPDEARTDPPHLYSYATIAAARTTYAVLRNRLKSEGYVLRSRS